MKNQFIAPLANIANREHCGSMRILRNSKVASLLEFEDQRGVKWYQVHHKKKVMDDQGSIVVFTMNPSQAKELFRTFTLYTK